MSARETVIDRRPDLYNGILDAGFSGGHSIVRGCYGFQHRRAGTDVFLRSTGTVELSNRGESWKVTFPPAVPDDIVVAAIHAAVAAHPSGGES